MPASLPRARSRAFAAQMSAERSRMSRAAARMALDLSAALERPSRMDASRASEALVRASDMGRSFRRV